MKNFYAFIYARAIFLKLKMSVHLKIHCCINMLEDITLYEFNSLDALQKIEALGEYGQIVAHRFEGDFKFMRYQINEFYIELKYITEGNVGFTFQIVGGLNLENQN